MGTYQTLDVTTVDVLRFACTNCKYAVDLPIITSLAPPEQCRCGATWFSKMNNELTVAWQMVTQLANALAALRQAASTPESAEKDRERPLLKISVQFGIRDEG